MKTSLKAGFAQIFSRCPKNLSCPKFGGAAAPLAPSARTPMCTPSLLSKHLNWLPWEALGTTQQRFVKESSGHFRGPSYQ